ncbi:endonuclease/exonuclease/phosphatase family protein [Salegentibacter chungangensis]|uniref:Endonuclease/exonuclease/phosphatase family protein n=1 Tax=Salegentibacter chungangensis TaxID=1335724 RepID=A0ABW3NW98_9FLAO
MLKNIFSLIFLIAFGLSTQAQIEMMTYNIKYANENDGKNSWSQRKDHITNQLKFYEPEILGMQEALLSQLEHFKANLPGYQFVGVGREDGKEKGEYSAIFFDSSRFEVLKADTFWLSETPSQVSTGWDAALPRICTYAKFRERESGKEFWVFNTHFDHMGEKARQESAKLIWKKINEVNAGELPVVLMGDLNLEPDTEAIQFLSEKLNDSKSISENVVFGPEGTFNGYEFNQPVTRRIDYILVSDGIKVLKYGVLSDSKDQKYPSDHLPVLIKLNIQ